MNNSMMDDKISKRGQSLPDFFVLEIMQRAMEMGEQGEEIFQLTAGEPAKGIPKAAAQAAIEAIEKDLIRYTPSAGIMPLREKLVQHYKNWYDVDIASDRVILSIGASGGFLIAFMAAFDAGEKIALCAPAYPCYINLIRALGIEAIMLDNGIEDGFQATIDSVKRAHNANPDLKGVMLANPTNPTGAMVKDNDLKQIVEYCDQHQIWLICDEIYHGICYENDYKSVLNYSNNVIVLNSFSKYFSMTGWRLGWLIAPDCLKQIMLRMAQNFFVAPPAASQYAAVKVFDCTDELDARVEDYRCNRDLLMRELPTMGIKPLLLPQGGFYVYADISNIADDSLQFANELLKETGVALCSGLDFDLEDGQKYVRLSFVGAYENIEKAIETMRRYIFKNS